MEFGLQGSIFGGTWSLDSNTHKSGPRPHDVGEFPPQFVSMPHKQEMFEFLSALSTTANMRAIWVRQLDQGVDPDPACPAQHIPRAYDFGVVAIPPLINTPIVLMLAGCPIFNENDQFTGSFGPQLFTFNQEPPSENG
jgi:hypothetical protein